VGDLATDFDVDEPDVPDATTDLPVEPDAPVDVVEEDNPCIVPDSPGDVSGDTGSEVVLDVVEDDPGEPDADLDVAADADVDDAEIGEPDADLDVAADADVNDAEIGDPEVDDGTDTGAGDDGGSSFLCGDPLTDARDGRTYATALIGTQCWMTENLDVGSMIAGTTAQLDNGVLEKYCYDDDSLNCDAYGGMYQWDEMMDYGPSDAGNPSTTRGICPAGWHVPSDEEWKVLEIHLGMTPTEADLTNTWRGVGVGTALKPGGSSGYDALMSGRYTGATFQLLTQYEYMYSSTEFGTMAWRRCLGSVATTVGRWNTFPKDWALSVRCVLD